MQGLFRGIVFGSNNTKSFIFILQFSFFSRAAEAVFVTRWTKAKLKVLRSLICIVPEAANSIQPKKRDLASWTPEKEKKSSEMLHFAGLGSGQTIGKL